MKPTSGITLLELLVALAITGTVLSLGVPLARGAWAKTMVRSAASQTAASLRVARIAAIRSGRETAVRFEQRGGEWRFATYRDGNGNGVRNAEIASGIDRPAEQSQSWIRGDVRPGILDRIPVPDPSSPGRYLTGIDDPIRFNASNLCSFSPLASSTPGSIYLSDGRSEMAVIRVVGRTARIHVLYYTAGDRRWRP